MFASMTPSAERSLLSHHLRSSLGVRRAACSQGPLEQRIGINSRSSGIFRVRAPFALRSAANSTGGGKFSIVSSPFFLTIGVVRSRTLPSSESFAAVVRTRLVRNRKSFSSSSAATSSHRHVLVAPTGASSSGGSSSSSSRWQRIARIIRTVRIPLLVVSVYSLGYQQVGRTILLTVTHILGYAATVL